MPETQIGQAFGPRKWAETPIGVLKMPEKAYGSPMATTNQDSDPRSVVSTVVRDGQMLNSK